jgi:hypothetical protein
MLMPLIEGGTRGVLFFLGLVTTGSASISLSEGGSCVDEIEANGFELFFIARTKVGNYCNECLLLLVFNLFF